MSNRRLEMLALGIATLNDAFNPDSDAFQLFNWSLARAYSFKHLDSTDDRGRRVFSSVIGGFRFLMQDLQWKCNGDTRAKGENGKLKPTSTLRDLLIAFKIENQWTLDENLFTLIDFLTRALRDEEINSTTTLEFFVSEVH
jgi:hypothetical protein